MSLDQEVEHLGEHDDTGHKDGSGGESYTVSEIRSMRREDAVELTRDVSWGIGPGPKEDTVDRGRVTHGIDECDGDSSFLSWERDDVRYPNKDQWTNAVDRCESENDKHVLDHPGSRSDTYDEAYHSEEGKSTDKHWFILIVVRQERGGENKDESGGVEWDSVVLTRSTSPTEGTDKCWDEVLDSLGTSGEHVLVKVSHCH